MKRGTKACLLLLVSSLTSVTACERFALSPSAGVTRSQWQEYSATGSRLVKETGTLSQVQLDADLTCSKLQWHAYWAQSQGQRHYQGVTNKQQAATSTTDIRDQALQVDTMLQLNDHWSAGVGVAHRTIDRNILSTPQAAGYPERFSQWSALAGLRFQYPLNHSAQFLMTTWWGHILPGNVWLELPNTQPTRLMLGSGQIFEAGLALASTNSNEPGWSWSTQLNWRETRTSAGKSQAVLNNGRLVGSVLQPQTDTQSLGLRATLKYVF